MTDKAIAAFVAAIKLDRHDWEDWPKDSRAAFIALQASQPDCRTCANIGECEEYADGYVPCTNGDKYTEAPRVVLWRTES